MLPIGWPAAHCSFPPSSAGVVWDETCTREVQEQRLKVARALWYCAAAESCGKSEQFGYLTTLTKVVVTFGGLPKGRIYALALHPAPALSPFPHPEIHHKNKSVLCNPSSLHAAFGNCGRHISPSTPYRIRSLGKSIPSSVHDLHGRLVGYYKVLCPVGTGDPKSPVGSCSNRTD